MNIVRSIKKSLKRMLELTGGKNYLNKYSRRRRFNIPHHLRNFHSDKLPIEVMTRMREDGQVHAGLSAIKYPVLSSEYSLIGDDDRTVQFVKDNLNTIYRRLLKSLLRSLDYGFSVCEIVYETRGDRIYVEDIVELHPDDIRFILDDYGYITDVEVRREILIPAEKCIIYSHDSEFGNPYGRSRLLPAYQFWRTKELIYLFTNRYYERKGNPPTVIQYPAGTKYYSDDSDILDEVLDIGAKLMENAVVAVPNLRDGFGNELWSIQHLMDDARGKMFIDYLEHLNKMILRSLIVPERVISQDVAVGSYSMAKVHLDIFLLSEDGLISEIAKCINEQLIKPLVELNFRERTDIPQLHIEKLSQQNKQLLSDILIEMIRDDKVTPNPDKISSALGIEID